jgi:hypothetical protein
MTLDDLIERLVALRVQHGGTAEIRVSKPADIEDSINQPAREVTYTVMGPIHYVEVE